MSTIFTKIIQGEIPGVFVYRDDHVVAFMSINPLADGHVLVVPVKEVDHWIDMDPATNERVFAASHKISQAIARAFPCERVGLMIAGFEVNHVHVHLIPTQDMSDLNFANAAKSVDPQRLKDNAQKIIDQL